MNTLEKVATAIQGKVEEASGGGHEWIIHPIDIARAALEAMLEPIRTAAPTTTAAMLDDQRRLQ